MPPILTQVARISDALPLVATSTPTHNIILTTKHQQDAKQLLRSMTSGYVEFILLSLSCFQSSFMDMLNFFISNVIFHLFNKEYQNGDSIR
jgi:hypothetical protein